MPTSEDRPAARVMTESVARAATPYRPDIDGLRALAVLLVLVFHFGLWPGGGEAGFLGVDVFFVISGFLITRILVGQLEQGRFHPGRFYLHRVRRLAPALQATLLLVVAVGSWRLLPLDFAELCRQLLAAQWYVANVYYWQNVSYFGLGAERSLLLHTWSLAVEEQFYLLYPLALWAIHRWAPGRLRALVLTGLVVSFALNLGLVERKPGLAFYLLPTRAWELLAGAALALSALPSTRSPWLREGLGWLGLLAVLGGVLRFEPGTPVPGWHAWWPVGGTLALLAAGEGAGSRVSRLLAVAPLNYIGRISYPAYLVHWPLHVLALMTWGPDYDLPWRWLALAGSLVLAALLYHGVEGPIRRSRSWASPRVVIAVHVGLLLAVLALQLLSSATRGLPQRFPAEVARISAAALDRTPPLSACEFEAGRSPASDPACRLGVPGRPPRWLVFGDSHAWAAHDAFDQWLRHRGESGLFAFRHACPPLLEVHLVQDRGSCAGFNAAIHALLAREPALQGVLMVSTWLQAPEGRLLSAPGETPSAASSLAVFDRQFTATLQALQRMGRTVVLWEPVPGAPVDVPQALANQRLGRAVAAQLAWRREDYARRYAFFFEALDRERALIAARVSPSSMLCGSGLCEVALDGVPLYFDNGHVTAGSAAVWVQALEAGVPRTVLPEAPPH